MKIRLLVCNAIFAVLPAAVFAQIPNNSLDNWETTAGGVEKPVSWDTPDVIAATLGNTERVVEKESTTVHSGDAAAKLTSKTLDALGTPVNVPGTITLGTIGFDFGTFTPSITGGIPFTERPETMTFWYHYTPMGGDDADTAAFAISFTKDGTLIGGGTFRTAATTSGYTMGEATIDYATADDPDMMNIIITSSGGFNSVVPGSILYVDDIELTGLLGVEELPAGISGSVYPNPANDVINIKNPVGHDLLMMVTNLQGQTVGTIKMVSGMNALSVSGYANGLYVFTLFDEGNLLYQGRFIVAH